MDLVEHFDTDLKVPPIVDLRSLEYVLQEVELFQTRNEIKALLGELDKAGFVRHEDEDGQALNIGIKKLLSMIELARQEPENVLNRLSSALMGLGMPRN